MKEKSPRILPWALCHLEGRELRIRREAETARTQAGPELCDRAAGQSREASVSGAFFHIAQEAMGFPHVPSLV